MARTTKKNKNTKLTVMQARFCEEYILCLRPGEAAKRAGYTANAKNNISGSQYNVVGSKIMRSPYVQAELNRLFEARTRRGAVTFDTIMAELMKIGFVNIGDLIHGDGVLKNLDDLDPDLTAAIQEITFTELPGGQKTTKVKLYSKLEALEMMNKMLGFVQLHMKVSGQVQHDHKHGLTNEIVDAMKMKFLGIRQPLTIAANDG